MCPERTQTDVVGRVGIEPTIKPLKEGHPTPRGISPHLTGVDGMTKAICAFSNLWNHNALVSRRHSSGRALSVADVSGRIVRRHPAARGSAAVAGSVRPTRGARRAAPRIQMQAEPEITCIHAAAASGY